MGTHLRVLSKSSPINTNMTGFGWFSETLVPCALDENNLSIGRVNPQTLRVSPDGIVFYSHTYFKSHQASFGCSK